MNQSRALGQGVRLRIATLVTALTLAGAAVADHPSTQGVALQVLSGRADMVSGTDALLSLRLPAWIPPRAVRLEFNGSGCCRTRTSPCCSGSGPNIVCGSPAWRATPCSPASP